MSYEKLIKETEVSSIDINSTDISSIADKTYTGSALTPKPIITRTLIKDVDYTLKYENNNLIGTGTVIVTGIGAYNGTLSDTFGIILVAKGDLITMTLGNDTPAAGTQDLYRVLSINGTDAFVMAMYDLSTSQVFNNSSVTTTIGSLECQKYQDSSLDTYLNSTFYSSLNSTAKAAIIALTITLDAWYINSTNGNPDYNSTYSGSTSRPYSLGASGGAVGSRYVYALSMQEIIDYLGVTTSMTTSNTTFTSANIWTMFWNTTSKPSTITYPWLRSAYADDSSRALRVGGNCGNVYYSNGGLAARPAFHIDLSKITYTILS